MPLSFNPSINKSKQAYLETHLPETLAMINNTLRPMRSRINCFDKFILFYLLFGLLVVSLVGVVLGIFLHFSASIVIGILYFTVLGVFVVYTKR
jgi:hypothetical protein